MHNYMRNLIKIYHVFHELWAVSLTADGLTNTVIVVHTYGTCNPPLINSNGAIIESSALEQSVISYRDSTDNLQLLQIFSGVVWQSRDLPCNMLYLLSHRLCFFEFIVLNHDLFVC